MPDPEAPRVPPPTAADRARTAEPPAGPLSPTTPRIVWDDSPLLPGQSRVDPRTGNVLAGGPVSEDDIDQSAAVELAKSFGSRLNPKTGEQVYFKLAKDFIKDQGTQVLIDQNFGTPRANQSPVPVAPWECRIGGSLFMVPPININVSTAFRAGSVTGGAIRQTSSPKFNSGYSETMVSMTLYFPTSESIWGFDTPDYTGFSGEGSFTINFDTDDYHIVDKFLSSLRGLIAQFRYAPFLPVRNSYLNNVHGINAVGLQSMTVSTVAGFPFCLAVNLNMVKFNHQVYMPMIEHFDDAMHWGKFRQYMGRCAARLSRVASQNFLTKEDIPSDVNDQPLGKVDTTLVSPEQLLQLSSAQGILDTAKNNAEDLSPTRTFNKKKDIEDGLFFEIYYPFHDPARIELPSLNPMTGLTDFKQDPQLFSLKGKTWWQSLLGFVGIDVATNTNVPELDAKRYFEEFGNTKSISVESRFLVDTIQQVGFTADKMSVSEFNKYVQKRINAPENAAIKNGSKLMQDDFKEQVRQKWFGAMYGMFLQNPDISRRIAIQDMKRHAIFIQEWEVPMVKVGLGDAGIREYIHVQSVNVSMGNNIASMQIQMQQEPTYQHIGGMDTTCSISMLVFGEKPLLLMRRAFDTMSGIARIEHGHGVMGFLGVKNIVTALCGMRYCMPGSFDVETIPNFPHVYQVRLTLTDFDIFQQKREMLSAEQQAQMVHTFKTKKNPFLRVKQMWGAINAYPDFPLSVRDDKGNVVGSLDPDFYFKAFEMIDEDVVDISPTTETQPTAGQDETLLKQAQGKENGMDFLREEGVHWSMGRVDDPKGEWLSYTKNGMQIRTGAQLLMQNGQHNEPTAENMITTSKVPGLTPAGGPNGYIKPYENGQGTLHQQFQSMLTDVQYRDKSGRMIRAYPTYMLWLISENGTYAGVRLFDNFYGLQSVVDFSINMSEDIMADTLILRISNIYSRLTTPFKDLLDETYSNTAKIINTFADTTRQQLSGMTDYLVNVDAIEIAPGARLHLRIGYSSNPNAMDIVFNGVVTQVETGEILTITAQSDALELGAIVNTTSKGGSSGKIDGSMVGFYLSEPRDLMIQLLSMGSGVFKEVFAHATNGKVFSENRFGIRHFGSILYQELNDEEKTKQAAKKDEFASFLGKEASVVVNPVNAGLNIAGVAGFINPAIADIVSNMSTNLAMKRDYELFKRNIYPGNGSGIAQFLGGDLGEGGLNIAMMPTGVDATGALIDPETGRKMEYDHDPISIVQAAQATQAEDQKGQSSWDQFYQQSGVPQAHELLKLMGVVSRSDDDLHGFDEVSFRASTYMKTVWDLFQTCAALLPNYIVAVRPFEDRSTVFYGKPHWTYTSGVIPITLGVGRVTDASGTEVNTEPPFELEDAEWKALFDQLSQELGQDRQLQDFYSGISTVEQVDPSSTTRGLAWTGANPASLPTFLNGATITAPKVSTLKMGLHLPTADTIDQDVQLHLQIPGLTPEFQHPFYMDRAGVTVHSTGSVGDLGGEANAGSADGTSDPFSQGGSAGDPTQGPGDPTKEHRAFFKDDDPSWPGVPGSFGILKPEDEQWYIAMNWRVEESKENLKTQRIMVYCPRTNRACVCAPGDSTTGGVVVSPDTMMVLAAQPGKDRIFLGFVDPLTKLGPKDLTNYIKPGTENMAPTALDAHNVQDIRDPGDPAHPDPLGQEVQKAIQDSTAAMGLVSLPWAKGSDPVKYAYENGWSNPDVPVNFSGAAKQDPESGIIYDEAGEKAASFYGIHGQRSDSQANEIWTQFRERFRDEQITKEVFASAYPQFKHSVAQPNKLTLQDVERILGIPNIDLNKSYVISRAQLKMLGINWQDYGGSSKSKDEVNFIVGHMDLAKSDVGEVSGQVAPTGKSGIEIYNEVMDEYMKFMWRNPFCRGWLVRTADAQFDFVTGVLKSALTIGGAAVGGLTGSVLGPVGTIVGGAVGGAIGGVTTKLIENVFGDVGGDNKKKWNFNNAHKSFQIFITDGPQSCVAWMRAHADAGKDNSGILGRLAEETYRGVVQPVKDIAGQVATIVGGVVSGLSAFMKLSLLQMNHGVGMKNNMQRRTNMLNRLYNDSIYFDVKIPGRITAKGPSLSFLADNPFTREYGEPVVEIREPFQRIHYVSSFQHILKNSIIETSDDVATVVTAVSNGSHPVTVHFDKGAPAEFQREKVVETGLLWDSVGGLPLLKSIPVVGELSKAVNSLFHLPTAIRGGIKSDQVSDEISSKRVALANLKESLKDIYTGELLLLGDASIRPHDLVYLADVYERMYGFFEVESVTHHFTPETGFVTGVVPNALVTVNDPGRWSLTGLVNSRMSMNRLRGYMRHALQVRVGDQGTVAGAGAGETFTIDQLVNMSSQQILDSTQYAGGMTSIIKDVAGSTAIGGIVGGGALGGAASILGAGSSAALVGAATGVGAVLGGSLIWDAWKWTRDNLLDQHGCYIQYLTRMGQPMTAGLSPNASVAVGQQHGTTFTLGGLRLGTLPTKNDVTGQYQITTSELLQQIGYTPKQIEDTAQFSTHFVEESYKKVLKLTSRGDAPAGQYDVIWVRIIRVVDGDTIVVEGSPAGSLAGHNPKIRLLVINAPEDPLKAEAADTVADPFSTNATELVSLSRNPGVFASQYTRARLLSTGDNPVAHAIFDQMERDGSDLKPYGFEIALRILKNEQKDKFGRTLAFIFHQGLRGQTAEDRKKYILAAANSDTDWQGYNIQGLPLTFNQEILQSGHATIEPTPLQRSLLGQGIVRSGG